MRAPESLGQLIRFCLVGAVNTALTFLIFFVLFRVGGINEFISNAAGYAAGLICSFLLNRFFTFKVIKRPDPLEAVLFLAVFAVSFSLQSALFALLLKAHFAVEVSQLFSMAVYTAANFAGNKIFTFRKNSAAA